MRRSPDVSPRRLSDISPQLRQLKYLVVDEAIKEDLKWSRSVEDLTSASVGLTSIEERILRITGYYGYQPWAASYKRTVFQHLIRFLKCKGRGGETHVRCSQIVESYSDAATSITELNISEILVINKSVFCGPEFECSGFMQARDYVKTRQIIGMAGEDNMRAVKLPFYLELFETGRVESFDNSSFKTECPCLSLRIVSDECESSWGIQGEKADLHTAEAAPSPSAAPLPWLQENTGDIGQGNPLAVGDQMLPRTHRCLPGQCGSVDV
ncbi:hypothetical protein Q9966_012418 [Columba livia]|nr:hypothetical protein Q9966_012418 [Columba livia]